MQTKVGPDLEAKVLPHILQVIEKQGELKAVAMSIAERRRWRGTPSTSLDTWCANVRHMLDPTHAYHYGLLDHLVVVRELRFDPAAHFFVAAAEAA